MRYYKMWWRELYCILATASLIQFISAADNLCETVESEVGECVTITECKILNEVFLTIPLPMTETVTEYLQLSHCGFIGTIPKNTGRYRRACMRNCMTLREAREVCQNRPIWRAVVAAYPVGAGYGMMVCCPYTLYGRSYFKDLAGHRNSYLLKENACGISHRPRILGGTAAYINEFPWMALLIYDSTPSQYLCGGTLITNRYVLTAAHCITDELKRIRLGEHSINNITDCALFLDKLYCAPPYQEFRIERTIRHELYYNRNSVNDIALIRLSRAIEQNEVNVMPVCLPLFKNTRDMPLDGLNLTVIGWGFTEKAQSDVLLKVPVMVISQDECESKYGINGDELRIMNKRICAGTKGQDSCRGDSGGPLMYLGVYDYQVRYIQHGIVSYGSWDCGNEMPAVYTRVTKYMKWILDHLES